MNPQEKMSDSLEFYKDSVVIFMSKHDKLGGEGGKWATQFWIGMYVWIVGLIDRWISFLGVYNSTGGIQISFQGKDIIIIINPQEGILNPSSGIINP